jgi:hypothetical protein
MVNNCTYCTVAAFGLVALIVYTFFQYGIGAGCILLTALVLWFTICFHAILKARQDENDQLK